MSSLWVIITTVCRNSALVRLISPSTSALVLLSRLPVGSSASTIAGLVIRARAIATRCCCPPERFGWQLYPFPILIKVINLAALGKPFPMFVHCPHSEQDMGVGIMSRRMGVMDGKISNHAFGNKLLLAELPDKDSVLVGRYLSWDGKHPPPCKLGVPLFFHRFGGIP